MGNSGKAMITAGVLAGVIAKEAEARLIHGWVTVQGATVVATSE